MVFTILFIPILPPIIHRHQFLDPKILKDQPHTIIQVKILLLPATVSMPIYMTYRIENEVKMRIFCILMQCKGNLIFRSYLITNCIADTI